MLLSKYKIAMSVTEKGRYVKAKWQSPKQLIDGDYYFKISEGVVRFVRYDHIKGVEPKHKSNPNENHIAPFCKHNSHTQNDIVSMATTNNKYHRPKVKYFKNGILVSKEEYELAVKPRTNGKIVMFNVLLENLLELNGVN